MFSFFSKNEEEVVAIFDIGNGSIGGALVLFTRDGIPTILYTHREPIAYLPHLTSKRLLDNMLKLLGSVASHLQKHGVSHLRKTMHIHSVKHGFCVFSSPWYMSHTRIKKVEHDEPTMITRKFIDDLIKEEEREFLTALHKGEYEKMFGTDIRLLEKKIIHTKLNGYEVEHPLDKKAQNLEITFFSSYISHSIIESIEDTLHKYFHFKTLKYHSYALASWNAVRDMYPTMNDFLFIDITGEVTDIMLTQGGVLYETHSFPLGRSMILRKIVEQLDVPPEVAASFLSILSRGTLDKVFVDKMKHILKGSQDFWVTTFVKTLTQLKLAHVLPRKLFITADADVIHFFAEALSERLPPEMNILNNGFDIVLLNPDDVKSLAHVAGGVQRDTFLSIESEFLNKIAFDIV